MAIHRSRIPTLSRAIVDDLQKKGFLVTEAQIDHLSSLVSEVFFNEITLEERLNEETYQLLAKFGKEIERERADYRRLFEMTRKKLAKDKNIVL